ncbi:MAG: hypothetical protein WED04_11980 [Promethearchaeati archaeon SRVP18_Atabeyarchaeia-1]
MSKKVSIPVMSLTITGVLYILGLLLVTLKFYFVPVALATAPAATQTLVNDFLGFLAAFLVIWALTSIVLHPDIDDENLKWVFIFFSIIIIISVFTSAFNFIMALI